MEVLAEASFAPEQPDDPRSWAAGRGPRAVLLAVETAGDLGLVVDLHAEREDLVVVALVREPSPDAVCQALLAGACSAAGWDATGEELVALLDAGLQERSIIPTPVARQLVRGRPGNGMLPAPLNETQVEWLRQLASGMTVAVLAERVGYSERETYRLLGAIYRTLGARNRSQALVKAAQLGLLG
jgi:DNA-binding NarL/FixJ family response regulator